jgi:hypothetical protein
VRIKGIELLLFSTLNAYATNQITDLESDRNISFVLNFCPFILESKKKMGSVQKHFLCEAAALSPRRLWAAPPLARAALFNRFHTLSHSLAHSLTRQPPHMQISPSHGRRNLKTMPTPKLRVGGRLQAVQF